MNQTKNWLIVTGIIFISGFTVDGIARQQATGKTLAQTILLTGEKVNECSNISLNAGITALENSF